MELVCVGGALGGGDCCFLLLGLDGIPSLLGDAKCQTTPVPGRSCFNPIKQGVFLRLKTRSLYWGGRGG